MDILKFNFTVFNYCGLWWPEETRSSKKRLYTIETLIFLTMIYAFTLMQLFDVVLGDYNIDEITYNFFTLFTMISHCFKVTNFVIRRKTIVVLLDALRKNICRPQNIAEATIQKRFDGVARSNTVLLVSIAEVTAVGFLVIPILTQGYKDRILPFKVWLPYSLTSRLAYWTTYVYQCITILAAVIVNVVTDTLVSGLIVKACAQLEILKDRILEMVNYYRQSLADRDVKSADHVDAKFASTVKICVQHHVIISEFVATLEKVFSWVVFSQFFVSMLTLCSSIFKLSQKGATGTEIVTFVGYFVTMSMELLFYCWHGNEIKLRSLSLSDAVFATEWTILPPKIRRSLALIMARSSSPIKITCGFTLPMSLETYTMVLKASYSAFNLLQKS